MNYKQVIDFPAHYRYAYSYHMYSAGVIIIIIVVVYPNNHTHTCLCYRLACTAAEPGLSLCNADVWSPPHLIHSA